MHLALTGWKHDSMEALLELKSHSWTVQIRELLHQYNLPSALDLANNQPELWKWKKQVKRQVTSYWHNKLCNEAAEMKTLQYLNLNMCSLETGHPVWETGHDPRQVPKAAVRAQILTGRYPLTGHSCAGKRQVQKCPYCPADEPETVAHFILRCSAHQDIRSSYIDCLQELTGLQIETLPDEELIRTLIDPSHLTQYWQEAVQLEAAARSFFFRMHHKRAVADGRGSMNVWATRKSSGAILAKRASITRATTRATKRATYGQKPDRLEADPHPQPLPRRTWI
jgi:hypothetical protein